MSASGHRRRLAGLVLICATVVAGPIRSGDSPEPTLTDASPTSMQERRLVQSLIDVRQGRLLDALRSVDFLVRQQPDFRLAQLVRGDLLLAMTGNLRQFAAGAPPPRAGEFQQEALARLRRYLAPPPPGTLPSALLRLPRETPAAILVDLERYRLYLIENRNGGPRRTRDFYVSIGKGGSNKRREGDEKTPVGVYVVTSFIPGSRLPDLYGVGAFPINYPNGWDRLQGRTGSGIWIHGTESANYSRPPLSSLGCVTLSNQDFSILDGAVELGKTPVVVAPRLEWVRGDELERRRGELEASIERWRRDWESLDTERYLGHYAPDFRTPSMSRARFAAHKRRVNAGKRRIEVKLDQVGLYAHPGEPGLIVADFRQSYRSDTFRASARKQQYWRRGEDGWQIVFEEKI